MEYVVRLENVGPFGETGYLRHIMKKHKLRTRLCVQDKKQATIFQEKSFAEEEALRVSSVAGQKAWVEEF